MHYKYRAFVVVGIFGLFFPGLGCGGLTTLGDSSKPVQAGTGGTELGGAASDPKSQSPSDSGGSSGTGGASSSTGGATAVVLAPAEEFCADACAGVPLGLGCVGLTQCPEDPSVESECLTQADTWNQDARDAYVWCLQNHPLCFVSGTGCIIDVLAGDRLVPMTITASGFGAYDGAAWSLDPNLAEVSGVIKDGAFVAEFKMGVSYDFGISAKIWVDLNENGVCEVDQDMMVYALLEFEGDVGNLRWSGSVTPDDALIFPQEACDSWP